MAIVSSALKTELAQTDGRFWITETHTFDDGSEQSFTYLCDQKADPDKIAAERAVVIEAAIAEADRQAKDPILLKLKSDDLRAQSVELIKQADAIDTLIAAVKAEEAALGPR